MPTAALQFTQNLVTGGAGQAFVGAPGLVVTVANGNDAGVIMWTFTLFAVPSGSSFSTGQQQSGPTPTFTFTPDVAGSYVFGLTVTDGFTSAGDSRSFIAQDTRGWLYPSHLDNDSTFNYGSPPNPNGWMPGLNFILKDVHDNAFVSTSIAYTPTTPADWAFGPTTAQQAFDGLAEGLLSSTFVTNVGYSPGTPSNWDTPPGTAQLAFDALASGSLGHTFVTNVGYSPGTPSNWDTPPGTAQAAFDTLASGLLGPTFVTNVAYNPTTPGNWTSVPATAQEALDDLAARSAPDPLRPSATTTLTTSDTSTHVMTGLTMALSNNANTEVSVLVVADSTADSATFYLHGSYKRQGGGAPSALTYTNAPNNTAATGGASAWTASLVLSGNNITVVVQEPAGTTVQWTGEIQLTIGAHP